MQATCSHCGTRSALSEAQIGRHPRVQFHAARTAGSTPSVASLARLIALQVVYTPPAESQVETGPDPAALLGPDAGNLGLPAGKNIALAVLSGPAKGLVYALEKPWVVIGRTAGDLLINDPNISRWHCLRGSERRPDPRCATWTRPTCCVCRRRADRRKRTAPPVGIPRRRIGSASDHHRQAGRPAPIVCSRFVLL